MQIIQINTQPSYTITLGTDLSPEAFIQTIDKKIRQIVIISDETVGALYGQLFVDKVKQARTCHLLTFPAGEASKTRETKAGLEDRLSALGCQRDTLIVALGGGVVCDLAGFVAATYHRGIPCCYWPTTLLAIVDAAVGGKTAVNTPAGKNLIGTFTQPQSVMISLALLNTLPTAEWQAGLSEMIKHALLQGPQAIAQFQQQATAIQSQKAEALLPLIAANIRYKAAVVAQDPLERGLRASLNLGHTFAHMVEAASQYQMTHGSAVLWGLYWEACLGVWLGVTEKSLPAQIQALYQLSGISLPAIDWDVKTWLDFLKYDKKNSGEREEIAFVLLAQPGKFAAEQQILTKVPVSTLQQFFSTQSV